MADLNINQFTKVPITTTVEAKKLLEKVDANKDGTVSDAEKDAFIKANDSLPEAEKKVLLANVEIAKKAAPKELKIDGKDISSDPLITSPYKLADEKEDALWRNEINKTKGQVVVVDSKKGLDVINKELAGKDPLANPAEAAKTLVKGLWENQDGIKDSSGNFQQRRIIRMEEILGVQNKIKELEVKDPAKAAEFKKEFFAEMGKYITENFKNDAQFTFDSFLALHQSTAWGEGGHTPELKTFFEDMLSGIAQNTGLFKSKLDKVKTDGPQVIGNYDGTKDGNPFGSLAYVATANATGGIDFKFLEHATAPKENKAVGIDSNKAKEDLKKAVDEAKTLQEAAEKTTDKKFTEEQKKAIQALSTADVPTILSGGKDGLSILLGNLKILSGVPGLKAETLTFINSLIKQVEKLIAQASLATTTPAATTPAATTPATTTPAATTTSPAGGALPATPATPTPTATPTPASTPTPTATPTPAATPTPTPAATPTPTATPTPAATPTPTATPTSTSTATSTSTTTSTSTSTVTPPPVLQAPVSNVSLKENFSKFLDKFDAKLAEKVTIQGGGYNPEIQTLKRIKSELIEVNKTSPLDPVKLANVALELEQLEMRSTGSSSLGKELVGMLPAALKENPISGPVKIMGLYNDYRTAIFTGSDYTYSVLLNPDGTVSVTPNEGRLQGDKLISHSGSEAYADESSFAVAMSQIKDLNVLRDFLAKNSSQNNIYFNFGESDV